MTSNGVSSYSSRTTRSLTPGIFAPIPLFFVQGVRTSVYLRSIELHVVRLAGAGVRPLLAGTMGEGIHLTHGERTTLVRSARNALDGAGFSHIPIIVGTGSGSTRETIVLCEEVAAAGADAVIVIPPGYFAGVLSSHRRALKAFYVEVAERCPVPVLIYNYPGASAGIDLDSDLVVDLATSCPNLSGIKLTCGSVGKLTRIAAAVADPAFDKLYPRKNPNAPFLVLGGYADFLTSSAFAHGHGAITGLANIAPHALVKLFELSEAAATRDPSRLPEAQQLQGIIARADFTIAKASISGTKFLTERLFGYGGLPRKPLPPIDPEDAERLWKHPHVQELLKTELEFSDEQPL
ncbi:dihydrodipicolinate synthetase [Multifurca ochricompacta]|uniref:Dihydrodipicolinate synthetase n=1 Tax=Multifurca ochricompacta TaxID=376703 RepID=A0AAD4QRS0_9AGAM|nr:dihydrodipicolinate synthetase [Multifurca ochricompacta]